MNTKPIGSSRPTTQTPAQTPTTPTQRAMKQFSQTDAESGRDTPEIEKAPPPKKGDRGGRGARQPGQLDPGSSPYEEPNSEQRDR